MSDSDPLWTIIMREIQKETIFQNEDILSSNYVPTSLPHREDKIRELTQQFRHVFLGNKMQGRRVLITGPIGSGKTSLSKSFGKYLVETGNKMQKEIKYVHINCRVRKNPFLILLAMARALNEHIPARGHSRFELLNGTIEHLVLNNIHLVVSLDEFDSLPPKMGTDLIYSILRAAEDNDVTYNPISLILISRFLNSTNKLDESTRSSFLSNVIALKSYTRDQLRDILAERIQHAFRQGSIGSQALELILDISSVDGDARFALELLWSSGKAADSQTAREITCEHVRLAKMKIEPQIDMDDLEALSDKQLLLLTAATLRLREAGTARVKLSTVIHEYQILCEVHKQSVEPEHRIEAWLKDLIKSKLLFSTNYSSEEIGISEIPLEIILTYYNKWSKHNNI